MACGTSNFSYTPHAAEQESALEGVYYLEYCAGSGIRMRPGPSPDISGGAGGHSTFFLGGACRDAAAGYPTLRLCDQLPASTVQGAGVSMDGVFKNANWMVTPGRDFFYNGGLARGERLTQAGYESVQQRAKQLGLLDGIELNAEDYDDKPAGMSNRDYAYAITIGTDYAMDLARGRYCARVPVSRDQMVRMVGFLNAENERYHHGPDSFNSSVFQNNCVHLSHNALAMAGIWEDRPTDAFLPVAIINFPTPEDDFANLMRRTNDTKLDDLVALYHDPAARQIVLEFGRLPVEPGALATAFPPHAPNDVFDTAVSLFPYDLSPLRPYNRRVKRMFTTPRYTDPAANLRYFAGLYAGLAAQRRPVTAWENHLPVAQRAEFGQFYARFYDRLAALQADIARQIAANPP